MFNDPQNSYNPHTVIEILALPCFQQFQLPAISWGHVRNTCFSFEQHGFLFCVWLLEGFVLMACKKKMIIQVFKLREISIWWNLHFNCTIFCHFFGGKGWSLKIFSTLCFQSSVESRIEVDKLTQTDNCTPPHPSFLPPALFEGGDGGMEFETRFKYCLNQRAQNYHRQVNQ